MRKGYVLISCEHGFEKSIIKKLQNVEGVLEMNRVSESYDIIVKIESQTQETLRELIMWKIRKIEKIRSLVSLIGKN